MYEEFFGLSLKPFDILPDPEFLFPSRTHKRVLTYLDYGIRQRAGFILLTGEIGSGKTTIIRNLLNRKPEGVVLSKVYNTKVSSEQLIALINEDFGLETAGRDKITLLRELNDFLIRQYGQGKQAVLIIDEAQNLSGELLEEVRLLSNLETDRHKFLQIILVGQPELRKSLAAPELMQLRQRIAVNCHIQPLSQEEAGEYILHRLERAGNRECARFSPEALEEIHQISRGIPRVINILCDYVLLAAFAAQSRDIELDLVREVASDLDFENQFWNSEPSSRPVSEPDPATGPEVQRQSEAQQTVLAQRQALKLTSLLKDFGQRLEALESEAAKLDREALVTMAARLTALEQGLKDCLERLPNMAAGCVPPEPTTRRIAPLGHFEDLSEPLAPSSADSEARGTGGDEGHEASDPTSAGRAEGEPSLDGLYADPVEAALPRRSFWRRLFES